MKKITSLILCFAMILSCMVITASACEATAGADGSEYYFDTTGMEVGDVVYVGGLAFEKAPEDAAPPTGPVTRSSTEGFSVTSFGGNLSMDKTLALNSTYRYFWIYVNNQGKAMSVSIGGNRYVGTVDPGPWYVYSTEQWPSSSQTVSFSCSTGLYGSANAMLCSTLEEAKNHN